MLSWRLTFDSCPEFGFQMQSCSGAGHLVVGQSRLDLCDLLDIYYLIYAWLMLMYKCVLNVRHAHTPRCVVSINELNMQAKWFFFPVGGLPHTQRHMINADNCEWQLNV